MQPEETGTNKSITRTDIAQWYGIAERALRYRMHNAKVCIANRVLTKNDIRLILHGLGEPPCIPPNLYKFYMSGSDI